MICYKSAPLLKEKLVGVSISNMGQDTHPFGTTRKSPDNCSKVDQTVNLCLQDDCNKCTLIGSCFLNCTSSSWCLAFFVLLTFCSLENFKMLHAVKNYKKQYTAW